jgi:hypothetical protein
MQFICQVLATLSRPRPHDRMLLVWGCHSCTQRASTLESNSQCWTILRAIKSKSFQSNQYGNTQSVSSSAHLLKFDNTVTSASPSLTKTTDLKVNFSLHSLLFLTLCLSCQPLFGSFNDDSSFGLDAASTNSSSNDLHLELEEMLKIRDAAPDLLTPKAQMTFQTPENMVRLVKR